VVWAESVSPSFRARHHIEDADSADRVLYGLEDTRAQLEQLFPRVPTHMTAVLHGGPFGLAFTNPLLPVMWVIATPANRRYIAGWVGTSELHVLSPHALAKRASNLDGSREMLALAPDALYAKRVVAENVPAIKNAPAANRLLLELRWAWLLQGAARYLVGQTEHARPAIARRLREGPPPRFPPDLKDAALLGQTVIDLLAETQGEPAVARLATKAATESPQRALTHAFGVRSFRKLDHAWRGHLLRLAEGHRAARLALVKSA
jgi:hypothetical protein